MPVVQKRRRVSLPFIPSNRTLYPTFEMKGKTNAKIILVPFSKGNVTIQRRRAMRQEFNKLRQKHTDSPRFSPRSAATLSATDIADIRLG